MTEPPGVGSVLAPYLADFYLLMSPSNFTASTVDLLFAVGMDDGGTVVQSPEYPTFDFMGAMWTDPMFATKAGGDITIDAGDGLIITLNDAAFGGYFSDGGNMMVNGTLSGQADTRSFDSLLGDEVGAVCELLGSLGIECEVCPADGQPYCLTLVAEDITAETVAGTLTPIE